jgi:hypothetical protein
MAKRDQTRVRRTRARNLCQHFDETSLAHCAEGGLAVLEAEHKPIVRGGSKIGCGVALDRCRQMQEPYALRWDYVFCQRDTDDAVAIEVHHTDVNEVDVMIGKKNWAAALLTAQCPDLKVVEWIWLASPPDGHIFILPTSPKAKLLAEARIRFPRVAIDLP